MIVPDVNVLVHAFRSDSERHELCRRWLQDAVAGPETVGLSDAVSIGTARVLTHPRVFSPPAALGAVLDLLGELRSQDGVVRLVPGAQFISVFERISRAADARGNLLADAQHAALAIEHGATLVTFDRDFARFAGLRWHPPQ